MSAVFAAIRNVMHDIGQHGISKGRKNQQQGYSFRGIDDVYNELNGLLSKHGLIMAPRILSREVAERQTLKGGVLFYVTVEAEFDLVAAEDGSKHTIRTFGEAMDSADKATNKAMSAAYKYAAMMLFCIPTEGENDADAVTHEVSPQEDKPKAVSAAQQKRGLEEIERELLDCDSVFAVDKCAEAWRFIAKRDGWSKDYLTVAGDKFKARKLALQREDAEDIFPGDLPNGRAVLQHPVNAR